MAEQQVSNPENYLYFGLVLETTSILQISQPDKVALEQNRKINVQLNLDLDVELGPFCSVAPAYIHLISSFTSSES